MLDDLPALPREVAQVLNFPVHRGGNGPKEVNMLAQGDGTELELDTGCAGCVQEKNRRERLLKGGLHLLPRTGLLGALPSFTSTCTRLTCPLNASSMFCLMGSLGLLLLAPSEAPLSAGQEITLSLCPGQCWQSSSQGSLDVNGISRLQDPVL